MDSCYSSVSPTLDRAERHRMLCDSNDIFIQLIKNVRQVKYSLHCYNCDKNTDTAIVYNKLLGSRQCCQQPGARLQIIWWSLPLLLNN